jgi:hypothetical protein
MGTASADWCLRLVELGRGGGVPRVWVLGWTGAYVYGDGLKVWEDADADADVERGGDAEV